MASPIFVTGYGRSGTTLVQGILSAHSDVALKTENNIIYNLLLAEHDFRTPCSPKEAATTIRNSARVGEQVRTFLAAAGDLETLFVEAEVSCLADAVQALLRQSETAPRWGDKSLLTALVLPQLSEIWPDAYAVHIVRDPRDVALSFFRKRAAKLAGAETVEDIAASRADWAVFYAHARRWQHWNQAVEAQRSTTCITIRYEDLVGEPEETVSRLCDFLGLPLQPSMLDGMARKALARHPAHQRVSQAIINTRIGQWSVLDESLLRCVEDACPLMQRYGYGRETTKRFSLGQHFCRLAAVRTLRHLPGLPEIPARERRAAMGDAL